MGCDIHLQVEQRINGRWGEAFPNVPCSGSHSEDYPLKSCYWCKGSGYESTYSGRNYDLFAILADVRNYSEIAPIASPRGVPVDASHSYLEKVREWGCDGHSHSYFTLKELLDFNWEKSINKTALVALEEYKRVKKENDTPKCCCRWVSGPVINQEQADAIIANGSLPTDWTHVEYSWEESPRDLCRGFWDHFLPSLKELDPNPENIRIVFFFDN